MLNPPSSPDMRGTWKRMIGTVKEKHNLNPLMHNAP